MHACTIADLGPGFIGWAADTQDGVIIIATPHIANDPNKRAAISELMRRHGIHTTCANCPLRTDD